MGLCFNRYRVKYKKVTKMMREKLGYKIKIINENGESQ